MHLAASKLPWDLIASLGSVNGTRVPLRTVGLVHVTDVSVLVAEGLRIFELEGLQLLLAFGGLVWYVSARPVALFQWVSNVPPMRFLVSDLFWPSFFSGMSKMKHVVIFLSAPASQAPAPRWFNQRRRRKKMYKETFFFSSLGIVHEHKVVPRAAGRALLYFPI